MDLHQRLEHARTACIPANSVVQSLYIAGAIEQPTGWMFGDDQVAPYLGKQLATPEEGSLAVFRVGGRFADMGAVIEVTPLSPIIAYTRGQGMPLEERAAIAQLAEMAVCTDEEVSVEYHAVSRGSETRH